MRKIKVYIIKVILGILFVCTLCVNNVLANENEYYKEIEYDIIFYSDNIVFKYRTTNDGVVQYRRWNETKGCWVDPYWINLW